MSKAVPAIEFLADESYAQGKGSVPAVCAVFGADAFLRRQVLDRLRATVVGQEDGDFAYTAIEGADADWRDVAAELATVAMFGGGRRLVVLSEADPFVEHFRDKLEDYVAAPAAMGVLVLELKSLPSNTRLYKAIVAAGLAIDATPPVGGQLAKWLTAWTKRTHQRELSLAAAELLVEMIGPELGLLDQELAKLALSTNDKKISPELVSRCVGSWRAKTVWEMLDAALDGNVGGAMEQLDRVLAAGEQPIVVLAQIASTLRRFAGATGLILRAEQTGQRVSLPQCLEQAGVKAFVLQKAERQLRRLTRHRGAELYRWLLDADLDLKGNSLLPARTVLERLLLRIAVPADRLKPRS